MNTHEQPSSTWESLYTTALLERDHAAFLPKAMAAQAAIRERLRQLPSPDIDESVERKALLEAVNNIQVLMSQETDSKRLPFAG